MGNIERFFLLNLLRISFAGSALILVSDLIYAQDRISITTDVVIVSACTLAFIVRRWSYNGSVLIVTCMTLLGVSYQWISKVHTITSVAIILITGFIFSILLKGKIMWIMHAITILCVVLILIGQTQFATDAPLTMGNQFVIGITVFVLYFVISYSTGILKLRYDKVNQELLEANGKLLEKANEIEAKNKALEASHEDVHEMNRNLERLVMERTMKVHAQNEMLLKYTYTNAHHLRGPVARLLGLISIHKLESDPDHEFFFSKMEDQAHEIDSVVKQINSELEKDPTSKPPSPELPARGPVRREGPP